MKKNIPHLLTAALCWFGSAFAAEPVEPAGFLNVIIQSDGAVAELSDKIAAAGGQVRFKYKNVSAVAARIPVSQLSALAKLAGVTRIEKDRVFQLNEVNNPRFSSHVVAKDFNRKLQKLPISELKALPQGYANFLHTGAAAIWEQTSFGEGTVVAVVDTGVAPNLELEHAVIGAPGFPDGFNAFPDGGKATDIDNHWHGTLVAGTIAGAVGLLIDPADPLYAAVTRYMPEYLPTDPGDPLLLPVLGQAPGAKIYPVKVFPKDGGGTPNSIIMAGLDHVLTLKKSGALDIDIVNMSLGGPTGADGLDIYDRFIHQLTEANILTVAAAGNDGPVPGTIGSPGTSLATVSVGALDYALSSRVFYEWLGYQLEIGPGFGSALRPTDETRVVNFSSRGPTSDGRVGPEISALGTWNFGLDPNNFLFWVSGTSLAAPTVAGVGALLNADWESRNPDTNPKLLEAALLSSADPNVVGEHWRSTSAQGYGVVNAPGALAALQNNRLSFKQHENVPLKASILEKPVKGKTKTWNSNTIELDPGQTFDAVVEIGSVTSKLIIELYDINTTAIDPLAFNLLEVHVQSAQRSVRVNPIAAFWSGDFDGDSFTIVIEDGLWTLAGQPVTQQTMEPGLFKITLAGEMGNHDPVTCKVRITRANDLIRLENPLASGGIKADEAHFFPIEIPAGTHAATFDLKWHRNWASFPTSDLDLVIFDNDGNVINVAGASFSAPERAILENPAPGTYHLLVYGFSVEKPDEYDLFMKVE